MPEPAFTADVDALLGLSERAERTACVAHVKSGLGDLVVRCPLPMPIPYCSDVRSSQAHVSAFYSVPTNYAAVTQPTLSSSYSAPQSYYIPSHICKSYQTCLEVTGLCTTPAEESEVEKPKRFGVEEKQKEDPKQTFKTAFQCERVSLWNTIAP